MSWRHASRAQLTPVIAVAVLVGLGGPSVVEAQAASRRSASTSSATNAVTSAARRRALDTWLVTRYRGAQLLPDTERARDALTDAPMPRVETANDGASVDTLFAVHFGTSREMSSIRVGARVRLTASSGAISTLAADVVARRAFRAPSRPGVDVSESGESMRFGWAYLALVPRRGEKSTAGVYRGWLLFDQSVDQPDSTRRNVKSGKSTGRVPPPTR